MVEVGAGSVLKSNPNLTAFRNPNLTAFRNPNPVLKLRAMVDRHP